MSRKYPVVTLSAYTLRVPGTSLSLVSISRPMPSMTFRSGPIIFIPTGVLMPVASMSMRAFMGMVKEFSVPGICRASFISSFIFSMVMPFGHWSSGFRLTMVSNISGGAGSVAVSALPALPNTLIRLSRLKPLGLAATSPCSLRDRLAGASVMP